MTAAALSLDGVPDWELRERARLEASRCPQCRALGVNHYTGCPRVPFPDPGREPCGQCGYPAGSLGCRLTHRRQA